MASLTEQQVVSIIQQLEQDFDPYISRMAVRRMLIERLPEMMKSNQVGTNVPKPFDKSAQIIQTVTGHVVDGVQHYAARIAANPPQPIVPRIAKPSAITQKAESNAAEQERLLSALWASLDGPKKQYQTAWSQSWCRVGWYLTLPREIGWGLPDRSYFTDLSDEDIAEMRDSEYLSLDADDGSTIFAESADNWIKRRSKAAEDNALSGNTLFTLESIPGDMVRYRMDRDGIKYAYVVEECPASDFTAGGEFMRDIATRLGYEGGDVDRFSIIMGEGGKVIAGVTQGGERESSKNSSFNFIRFFDRECVYYLVSGRGSPSSPSLIWAGSHGGGKCPLIPVPGIWTDSRRAGAEFSSPMESVFALAPLLNQVETLLSNAAAFNAIPRWVIEKADGSLVVDEQGNPKEVAGAPPPGLDPAEATVVDGKLRQLEIKADLLLELLKVYADQMKDAMPPDVAQGQGGTSGAAWAIRQLLSAAQADLEQPVSNHAAGVREVFDLWVRWMRLLDTPIYALSVPRNRSGVRAVRGLIEFDPADLVQGFEVVQSKDSASDRIVLQQHGIELRREGVIDDRRFFEEYMHEQDPVQAEKDMYAQNLKTQIAAYMIQQLLPMAQGRLWSGLMAKFPNSAILTSQLMAEQSQMQQAAGQPAGPMDNHALPRGNVAQANGLRQPGVGAPVSMPGSPDMGLNAANGRQQ